MPVATCFDAGNLQPVAKALHEKFSNKEIIICADNDAAREAGNVGVEKAKAAAASVGGRVIIPKFNGKGEGTDFNDLAAASGLQTVQQQLKAGLRSALDAGM